jgi:replicative DNA helicase
MKVLVDVSAERAVLAAVAQHGQEVYLDIADIIQESTFTVEYNKYAYAAIKQIFKHENVDKIDIVSILSAGSELGLDTYFDDVKFQNHLKSLFNCAVSEKNARRHAAKIRKLEITRLLKSHLEEAGSDLNAITGDESVASILSIAENKIFDFSSLLNDVDEAPAQISSGLSDYVQYLADNPLDQVGIETGFKLWDSSIGGGLRKGTLNLIGARSGVGKSVISGNMGYHIADAHNIPVLNMDTEMSKEDHINRLLAMASECFIHDIETGKFVQKPKSQETIKRVAAQIEKKKLPYFHKSIAGMPFEEQLAVMRRWIVKDVGLDSSGKAKPCVIVYDYLKLMSADGVSGALQEYQLLGFMMTSLHNFAVRYGIPILMFLQLNRDGVDKESTAAASGSDRIIWLCSNFTIFKEKSEEEMADCPSAGTHKLVVLKARHGGGRHSLDYINCYFQGAIAKVTEGENAFLVKKKYGQEEENSEDDKPGNDIEF